MSDEQKAQPKEGPQIQIALDEETAQGFYSNLAMVNHNQTEFTIDFIYVQPQGPKAKVRARVITSPSHFKRLIGAMNDNLAKYEAKFGIVEVAPPALNVPVH
ncbi:MAG: DUF3467 domain-containing protein [Deltaproteobacteria bacterium]|nr:DUF3467 domain-containing protein [Deltaproteobacteria bacterium]